MPGSYSAPAVGGGDESDPVALAALDAHVVDAADAHDASAISFAPTGTIAATDVQAAIAEAAAEAGGGGAAAAAGVRLRRVSFNSMNVNSGGWNDIPWDTVDAEDGGEWWTSGASIVSPVAGLVLVAAHAQFSGNTGGQHRLLRTVLDGVGIHEGGLGGLNGFHGSEATRAQVVGVLPVVIGSVIKIQTYQNVGSAILFATVPRVSVYTL